MSLPFEVERCHGIGAGLCKSCRRRESGDPFNQAYITPQPMTWNGWWLCEDHIPRLTRAQHREEALRQYAERINRAR